MESLKTKIPINTNEYSDGKKIPLSNIATRNIPTGHASRSLLNARENRENAKHGFVEKRLVKAEEDFWEANQEAEYFYFSGAWQYFYFSGASQ